MVIGVKRLVLDVLKPLGGHSIVELSKMLNEVRGVKEVTISSQEMDEQTETIKIVLEGSGMNYELIRKKLDTNGAVIHSVDEVKSGKGR